ncbi:MAG: hypothetical protein ACLUFW_11850 [Alistipes sp.]
MEMKKLDFAETLKDSIEIGVKNAPPIVVAVTLWLVTIWIPYLNIGTTIAFITFVVMFVLFVLAASIAMAIEASFWKQLKDNVE